MNFSPRPYPQGVEGRETERVQEYGEREMTGPITVMEWLCYSWLHTAVCSHCHSPPVQRHAALSVSPAKCVPHPSGSIFLKKPTVSPINVTVDIKETHTGPSQDRDQHVKCNLLHITHYPLQKKELVILLFCYTPQIVSFLLKLQTWPPICKIFLPGGSLMSAMRLKQATFHPSQAPLVL